MCVDDYQFRHYSAKRQKICRRFIFRTQEGLERAFNVNISQFERYGQLCLCEILMHLSKKGLNIKDYKFYMPQFDITVEAGDRCRVPFDIMSQKQVHFLMKLIQKPAQNDNYNVLYYDPLQSTHEMEQQKMPTNMPNSELNKNNQICYQCQNWKPEVMPKNIQENIIVFESNSDENKSQSQKQVFLNSGYNIKIKETNNNVTQKKHKEQQKTIEQALTKTKVWRMLHENCNFSLKNAAQMVELSKKTLDDYFLVLRVGQAHGYNFKVNLTKKIGHLRAFIRNQPVKISGRLPKQVKSFDLVPNPDLTKFLEIVNWDKLKDIQQQSIEKSESGNSAQQHMIPQ